jgi:3',5'-cyclic AMP phosphodiesterase CpdA
VPVVVHLSDTHFGAHSDELAESLLADLEAQQPDLVVVSGDLTQRARRAQFRDARAFLDRLPGRLLSVVGNHDLPLFDLPRRALSPQRRYESFITSDLDPVVTVPGVVAVGLDTMPAWRWKAGHVSARQAALLRAAFVTAPAGAWRVLVTHHPVLPADLSGLVGRELLVDACARAKVAVLLSGHTHIPAMQVVALGEDNGRSALGVVTGTAISRRTRGAPNAYAVLHLAGPMEPGASITVQVRHPAGSGWQPGRSARFGYAVAGVVTGPAE